MAITITTQTSGLTNRILYDTAAGDGAVVNATGAPGTLYFFFANNASGNTVYLKFYDTAAPVTVGTTVPDYVFQIEASAGRQYILPGGTTFATGISYCCVREGGTAGTTAPAASVAVWLVTS